MVARETTRREERHCPLWSTADMCGAKPNVCFTPDSRHVQCIRPCPLRAKSGHDKAVARLRNDGLYLDGDQLNARRRPLSPRDVARILLTRSATTFMAAAKTSAQRAAFEIVSIGPSTSMA